MPYIVNTFDDVEAYLNGVQGLSPDALARLVEAYLRDLADRADYFLQNDPLEHESYLFHYRYILIDGGLCYSFRFVVDGSSMPYGVVQVVYLDHEARRMPERPQS